MPALLAICRLMGDNLNEELKHLRSAMNPTGVQAPALLKIEVHIVSYEPLFFISECFSRKASVFFSLCAVEGT